MVGQKGIVLNIGDKIYYKSNSMIRPGSIYEGEVIKCYNFFYVVLGKPIIKKTKKEIDNEKIYGEPKPYRFCISKYLDTMNEHVYLFNKEKENV